MVGILRGLTSPLEMAYYVMKYVYILIMILYYITYILKSKNYKYKLICLFWYQIISIYNIYYLYLMLHEIHFVLIKIKFFLKKTASPLLFQISRFTPAMTVKYIITECYQHISDLRKYYILPNKDAAMQH